MLANYKIDPIILRGLEEDISYIDITTDVLIDSSSISTATMHTKSEGVISGLNVAKRVFELVDPSLNIELMKKDGDYVNNQETIFKIEGSTQSILKGERVALNILQRMSGISTMAYAFSQEVKDYKIKVVDTRKTTPGLRILEKYAVKMGGCYNHRFNLSDAVMIKDNHIKAVGSISKAVKKAKDFLGHMVKIEVEVESLEQLKEAIDAGADIIMLDNMSDDMMKTAVEMNKNKAILEASGNMTLERLKKLGEIGIDIVSVGGLTHSVSAFDISLNIKSTL
jgi:nicotinate-nucleotide pyrophosphorylase (carboxylating)